MFSCKQNDADSFDVFHIEISAEVDEDLFNLNEVEFLPVVNLFNRSGLLYFYSEKKEKLIHNLRLENQIFTSIDVYAKGKRSDFQFVEYLGNSFMIRKNSNNFNAIRGVDWDLVKIKSKRKQFFDYDCTFAEGFSIIDGVEYTISGYICSEIKPNLTFVHSTEIMDLSGFWVKARVEVEGLVLNYWIIKHEKVNADKVYFPDPENFELIEYDPVFTYGFTNWLQN